MLSPYLKKYICLPRTYKVESGLNVPAAYEKGNPLSEGSVANKWKGYVLLGIHIYGRSFKFRSRNIAKIKVYN